jgi:cytochrome c biogenesis protein CcmG, thiol:disulfide interchange protein DsbE
LNRKVLVAGAVVALPLLGLLFANLGRDPHKVDSPLIGRPAPPFTLVPIGGGPAVTLDTFRGKVVVLNFWATWCVPCYEEHPALQAAARTMGRDVEFAGVIYEDEDAKVRAFLKQQGSAYPHFMDEGSKTAIAYGVYGVPETYFISPDGVVTDKYVGPLNPTALAALVARASTSARSALP